MPRKGLMPHQQWEQEEGESQLGQWSGGRELRAAKISEHRLPGIMGMQCRMAKVTLDRTGLGVASALYHSAGPDWGSTLWCSALQFRGFLQPQSPCAPRNSFVLHCWARLGLRFWASQRLRGFLQPRAQHTWILLSGNMSVSPWAMDFWDCLLPHKAR